MFCFDICFILKIGRLLSAFSLCDFLSSTICSALFSLTKSLAARGKNRTEAETIVAERSAMLHSATPQQAMWTVRLDYMGTEWRLAPLHGTSRHDRIQRVLHFRLGWHYITVYQGTEKCRRYDFQYRQVPAGSLGWLCMWYFLIFFQVCSQYDVKLSRTSLLGDAPHYSCPPRCVLPRCLKC